MSKKIVVAISQDEMQDLLDGETFDWHIDGVDVHVKLENLDEE